MPDDLQTIEAVVSIAAMIAGGFGFVWSRVQEHRRLQRLRQRNRNQGYLSYGGDSYGGQPRSSSGTAIWQITAIVFAALAAASLVVLILFATGTISVDNNDSGSEPIVAGNTPNLIPNILTPATATPGPIATTPVPTLTSSATLTPTNTPQPQTTPAPVITITDPVSEQKVKQLGMAYGTSQNVPADRNIWMVVYAHQAVAFFPQALPATIAINGDWAASVSVGNESWDQAGQKFDIMAVLVNATAQATFEQYIRESEAAGQFFGIEELPAGTDVYDRVTVIRE